MGDKTGISWTDATWNPVVGCSVVSPGCTNCYAMREAGTRLGSTKKYQGLTEETKAGPVWTGAVRFWEKALDQPLRWRSPRRIFVNSMGDLFHEEVPDQWIDEIHAVMALARQHIFQVLTKRPVRMRDYYAAPTLAERIWLEVGKYADSKPDAFADWMIMNRSVLAQHSEILEAHIAGRQARRLPADMLLELPLPNVWLGVSAEDQRRADERIPLLLETPAAVRWVSAEPLLGRLDIRPFMGRLIWGFPWQFDTGKPCEGLSWVVVGGESGAGARPMHPDWARSIRDQCISAGVPLFFKQWGEWCPDPDGLNTPMRLGKRAAGDLLDGQAWHEYPISR